MKCPNCGSILSEIKDNSSTYFICPGCRGILAKGNVLSNLLYKTQKSVKNTEKKSFETIKVNTIYSLSEKHFQCPICFKKMEKFNYAYDSNIFADRCSKCGYIWLNKGELEKIASHIAPNHYYDNLGSLLVTMMNIGKKEKIVEKNTSLPLFSLDSIVVGDEAKPYKFPSVTIFMIIFNFILMLILMTEYLSPGSRLSLFPFGFGNLLFSPFLSDSVEYLFLIHLVFNSLLLWIFGDNLEDSFGHVGFAMFYLFTWLFLSSLFIFITDSLMITVGYNATLSALMGAYLVLYPDVKLKIYSLFSNKIFKVSSSGSIVLFIGQQIFSIFTYGGNYKFGYFLQIAGFLMGCSAARVLKRLKLVKIIKNFSEFE